MIYQPGLSIMNQLVARAAAVTQFSVEELRGRSQKQLICRVRFAIMKLARAEGLPLTRIARGLGDRDHTTVMSGLKRAERLAATDADFKILLGMIDA